MNGGGEMKIIVIAVAVVLMTLVSALTANSYTIEKGAQIYGAVEGRMDIVDALVKFVKAHGYTCDSVSSASDNVFSKGFTLICNQYNYKYSILDKGGKWFLKVD